MSRRVSAGRQAGVVLAIAAVGIAGCSSSSKSSSSTPTTGSSSGTTAQAAASGTPLNIEGILTVSSPQLGFPEQADAIKAAAQTINAAGGVNGHPINVTICNDQDNPNTGATCAQQAVSNHAVAVIGGVSLGGSGVVPALEQAGIPDISDPVNPQEFSSPASWPVTGGIASYIGLGEALVTQYGCKKIAEVTSSQAQAQQTAGLESLGIAAAHGVMAGKVTTPAVNTDYAPAVAQVSSSGADCVILNFAGNEAVKAIPAFRQNAPSIKIAMSSAALPQSVITALKGAANGIILSDQNYPPNGTDPGVAAFRQAMAKFYPKDSADALAEVSWGAMQVFKQAANAVSGTIDAASLSKALGTLSSVDTTVGPRFSFTTPSTAKGFERIFNTKVIFYTVANDTYSYDSSSPQLDVAPVLSKL